MANRRYNVLVLEDDPTQGRVYKKILSSGPFEASLLNDPMLLIEDLDTMPVPDVMLLDVMLPSMDGICVLELLESHPRWCGVPAVMMTASPTPARIRAARRLPIPPEGFLAKPVNPGAMRDLLLAVIESSDPVHLKQRLQRQKLAMKNGIRADYEEIQRTFREACDIGKELGERMARNRREAQRLRVMKSRLTEAPAETHRSIGELLQTLERERERHQADARLSEELRNKILETKKGIRRKQLQINEIDHQLHVLSALPDEVSGQKNEPQQPEEMVILSAVGDVLDTEADGHDGLKGDAASLEATLDLGLEDDLDGLDLTGSDSSFI